MKVLELAVVIYTVSALTGIHFKIEIIVVGCYRIFKRNLHIDAYNYAAKWMPPNLACRHTVIKRMTRKRCCGFSFNKQMSLVCIKFFFTVLITKENEVNMKLWLFVGWFFCHLGFRECLGTLWVVWLLAWFHKFIINHLVYYDAVLIYYVYSLFDNWHSPVCVTGCIKAKMKHCKWPLKNPKWLP